MARIVFTGRGTDHLGNFIERPALEAFAASKGHVVTERVDRYTDTLVSSRTDTVKAREAQRRGIRVISYPTWLAENGYTRVGRDGFSGYRTERADPRRPKTHYENPARFVGTARPATPGLGDIWQPGGEGPAWQFLPVKAGSGTGEWVRMVTETEDDEWDFTEEPQERRTPIVFNESANPLGIDDLIAGDSWTCPVAIPRRRAVTTSFSYDGEQWRCTGHQEAVEAWYRFHYRTGDPLLRSFGSGSSAAYLYNLIKACMPYEEWEEAEDAVIAAEEEKKRIEQEILAQKAPRFNTLRPKREIDL